MYTLSACVAALFLVFSLFSPSPARTEPKAYDSEDFLRSANSVLNGNYQRILREYAGNPAFIGKFKASQRAWLQFRDAEMAALFPNDQMDLAHGWNLTEAQQYWLTKLTEERSLQLVRWLDCVEQARYQWDPCVNRTPAE